MDLTIYLQPIEKPNYDIDGTLHQRRLGDCIQAFYKDASFPNLDTIDLAIIGVNESRHSINNFECNRAADAVRPFLYSLYSFNQQVKIADIGNIEAGETSEDTYFALREVLKHLFERNIIPIIIGGSQDITYANYLAYESMGQVINITSIDSRFDLGNAEEEFNSRSYLSKIVLHQPNFLFNFTNLGYQTYFVDTESAKLMHKMLFDVYRLGVLRANLEETEPLVRNADLISFDIGAIRQSDAPGNANASPNGFYGEEACQITRYAGMSDKVSSIGFYEINPKLDNNNQSAHLVAQMIWYFMEGFYQRKNDFPHKQKHEYLKYTVTIENGKYEIVFYKSKKSGRWWMHVPVNELIETKYERHFMVPCSYNDYQTALNNEIPDRWWQVYQKMM